MPKRLDSPLGGIRLKLERQKADRMRANRKGKLDRVAMAFEQRSRARERTDRSWRKALGTGRAPFPRKGRD